MGYGNGTLSGSPSLVVTLGYGVGAALDIEAKPFCVAASAIYRPGPLASVAYRPGASGSSIGACG